MARRTGKKNSRTILLIIALVLVLILLLLLRSCGRHKAPMAPAPPATAPAKQETPEPEPVEKLPEEVVEPQARTPEKKPVKAAPPVESPAPEPVEKKTAPEPAVEIHTVPEPVRKTVPEPPPEKAETQERGTVSLPSGRERPAEAKPEEFDHARATPPELDIKTNWKPPPPDPDAEDEKLWKKARRANNEQAYRDYLSSFPNGRHSKEANEILRSGMYPTGKNPQGYQEFRYIKTNTLFVLIPAGEFWMGSPKGVGEPDEHPRHLVYLDAYYIQKYEVTIAQYEKFCEATGHSAPKKPWLTEEGDNPVIYPTWVDARDYCDWAGLRLPTEAEWEKAARGNTDTTFYWGDKPSRNMANFLGTGGKDKYDITSPVGSFPPNGYGLYDMAGNIWEWCADWYDPHYYDHQLEDGVIDNPTGPRKGEFKVIRGGSWNYEETKMRPAFRTRLEPRHWYDYNGFRTALSYMPDDE